MIYSYGVKYGNKNQCAGSQKKHLGEIFKGPLKNYVIQVGGWGHPKDDFGLCGGGCQCKDDR